ncbi:MAG TPA: hypothetical protein VII56_09080 [Rhizomicrobium sp.]
MGETTGIAPADTALTPQERRLIACAARGEWWRPEAIEGQDADPANADGWSSARRLRAELIHCLIAGDIWPGEAQPWALGPKGLRIEGAFVAGAFDLEGATLRGTLWLHRCVFDERLNFADATTRTISLSGSHLRRGLVAPRVTIRGALLLSHGFRASGGIDIRDARIDGQLGCSGGRFENPGGVALDAGALTAEVVYLNRGFSATGEVCLIGARIERQLDCIAGTFDNAGGFAINATSLAVGHSLQLRDGFCAHGEVNLVRATIGGSLRCEHATFSNAPGLAIDLSMAHVDAGFSLHNLRPAPGATRGLEGRLILDQAQCRTYCDDPRAWPEPGQLVLDGFVYERFHASDTRWRTRKDWLKHQVRGHLDGSFRPQPWTQTINVLRAMGHDGDARELAVQRELARARSKGTGGVEKFWLYALNVFVGNGYKPWRAAWWSALFVALGWFVFASAGEQGYMAPRDGNVRVSEAWNVAPPKVPRLPKTYPPFNALAFAFDSYLPVIAFEQDESWEPSTQKTLRSVQAAPDRALLGLTPRWLTLPDGFFAGGWHRLLYWILEILGWIFVSLFIAGMSGIMKKE